MRKKKTEQANAATAPKDAKSRRKMTGPEFAAAAAIARVGSDRLQVARAVLVEGKTYSEAVAPFGWTRQAAYGPIKSIEDGLTRYKNARVAELEAGWNRGESSGTSRAASGGSSLVPSTS